jgi:hypothetical protein
MGLLKLTESERLEILNLHNNARIIKEQATSLVSSTAPAAPAQTVADVIKELQTLLNTKYGTKLTVDGKWGNLTQTAFETAMKSKAAPAASTTTAPATGTTPATGTAAPAASTTTAPATGTAAPAASTTTAPATGTAAPAAPAASTTTAPPPATGTSTPEASTTSTSQPQLSAQSQQALSGQLTPQQIRQQGRFDQRLARQARRNTRRAGQQ